MELTTDLSISRDGKRLRLEFDTTTLPEMPATIVLERRAYGTEECEGRAMRAVEPILHGQRANVLTFFDPEPTVLVADPVSNETVVLDERPPSVEFLDATPTPPEKSCLDYPPIPVDTVSFVEELLRWVDDRCAALDPDTYAPLHDATAEAHEVYEYYREHGSLEGYEWVPDEEQIHEALFEAGKKDERVLEYIVRHDLVAEFVREFVERGDDAEQRLHRLLEHRDDRIADAALETLSTYDRLPPDVSRALLRLFWGFNHYPERVRRALPLFAFVENDDDFEHILERAEHAENAALRRTIADALGEIGGRRARETLETLQQNDADPEVREAAADALERLDTS